MVTPWQKPAIESSNTQSIIREYMEKMTSALDSESARLKEQAEQDAERIIAEAREEAESIIAQAKQRAQQESNDVMNRLKQDAERLLEESREKAVNEGRQKAEDIIREAREKAAGIITDLIDRGINKIEAELIRTVLSAKTMLEDEKSKLCNEAGKEEIIVEKQASEPGGIDILRPMAKAENTTRTLVRPMPGISVHVKA